MWGSSQFKSLKVAYVAGRNKDKQLSMGARQPEDHWIASGCFPIFLIN